MTTVENREPRPKKPLVFEVPRSVAATPGRKRIDCILIGPPETPATEVCQGVACRLGIEGALKGVQRFVQR